MIEVQEIPVHSADAQKEFGPSVWVLIVDGKVVLAGSELQIKKQKALGEEVRAGKR